jgi:AraC-like DNA-binding protein
MGEIRNYLVVFPRSAVWIRHAGSRPFVADPQTVTIYNRGQAYTRSPISAEGDCSDWFGVSAGVAAEIAQACHGSSDVDPNRPFRAEYVPGDSSLYAWQRFLFLRLARGELDLLQAEETVLALVARVIASASAGTVPRLRTRRVVEAHCDLAARARALIAQDVAAGTDVGSMARRLEVSPYHLCHVFRSQTGQTMHQYRLDLRFRMLLDRLEQGSRDLSAIAHDLGFASHSHMTTLFRRWCGQVPSTVRRQLQTTDTRLSLPVSSRR